MKNFIFISPNFPTNYWQFCKELKNNGLNVLGIGDQPYDELKDELKASLTEYFKVGNLENEDEVYRAVAFFAYKYGRIDWLESNNEYWLEKDAALRTDFHITSGFQTEDMERIKYKSKMKEYYKKAGIPVAKYHMVDDKAGCLEFIKEVGYPVIAKPDNGVGASDTHKITGEENLEKFLAKKASDVTYIMEEFIDAEIESYDAVINSKGEPLFETGNVTPFSVMDIVNTGDNCRYHIVKELAEDVREAGRKTVKSFGVKSRFVHFEFFRLLKDHAGLGKKGDVVALEVNMRPCGGFSPDMMNYAHSTDVYKIWADMIAFDACTLESNEHAFCAYAGRRDGKEFALSDGEVMEQYASQMKMRERIPEALSGAMGNQMYVARFETAEEMEDFYKDVFKTVEEEAPVEIKEEAVKEETSVAEVEVKEAAKEETPVAEVEVKEAAKEETPVAEVEVKEAAKEETPVAEVEVKEAAKEETPVAEVEVKEAAKEETPVAEVEVKEAAKEETPVAEVEVKEAVKEEVPIKEKKPAVKKTSTRKTTARKTTTKTATKTTTKTTAKTTTKTEPKVTTKKTTETTKTVKTETPKTTEAKASEAKVEESKTVAKKTGRGKRK